MPHVTLLYGGLVGALVTALGINVTRVRWKLGVYVDPAAPPKKLYVAIRAHSNAVEWSSILVMMLLLAELGGGSSPWLHVAGGLLFSSRLLHALGFVTRLRTAIVGSGLSWIVASWLPCWVLWLHFAK